MNKIVKEIEIKCKRCGVWKYQGNSLYYACCPVCHSTLSIKRNKVQVDPLVSAENQPGTIERKVI